MGSDPGLPTLGVGIVYSSAIEPLVVAEPNLIDVLEIEPQTTWIETDDGDAPYLVPDAVIEHLASLPGTKLVHSVGTPVGGSQRAHEEQYRLLRDAVRRLRAPWASEHLAFNLTSDHFTGFFLPPRQTDAGLPIYVEAITQLRTALGVPIAFETGVNYLRPRDDEWPDGAFARAVAEEADCGILLDLHNIYCNSRNGRQPVEIFLEQLPLERVWEVHLAGGFEMDGFWLDAHSGAIPDDVVAIAREVIPSLSSLKAINFEVFSSFVPSFGLDAVRGELERIRELWDLRGTAPRQQSGCTMDVAPPATDQISPASWERALGRAAIGVAPVTAFDAEVAAEPGSRLVEALVKEFRGAMVVGVYRLTSRLLMLALGPEIFRALLEDFWSTTPPRQFAGTEAESFADYLVAKDLRVPQLQNILAFERASLATLRDGASRVVSFDIDPLPMLRALLDGVLVQEAGTPGDYEIEVTAEGAFGVRRPDVVTGQVATSH